ncbi:response regulator [Roseovarius sp.]|jgi:two-component system nitrate/nitrite response regulator NarP
MQLRVLIADDHRLISEAVANLLVSDGGFTVELVDSFDLVMKALSGTTPFDLVLLDLKMPGMIGLESVRQIVKAAGSSQVVLFTGEVDRHFLDNALESGVRGLIPKTMPLQALVSVLQLVNSGQVFVPMQEISRNDKAGQSGNHNLSDKELFVLRLAADGLTNKEIARDLGTTEVTIKVHMRSICKKLGARNRAHAAIISRERALL